MTGPGPGGTGLEIRPRPLAAPDSLTTRILTGKGPGALPLAAALDAGAAPARRPARLDATAFGVSGPRAESRLAAVLGGEGYVVSTGHQPILFLGPLYVLYKALTAIAVAEHLERVMGAPVLPMFWIASDDHDWAEVARTTLLDREGGLVQLAIAPPPGEESRPVGPRELGAEVHDPLAELARLLPDSEFTPTYVKGLREAYRPEATFAEAFADSLHAVLGDRGYAWLDASAEAVKRASIPFFSAILERPGEVLGAFESGADRVAEMGFEPPIARIEGALPVFFDPGSGRQRVLQDGTEFRAGDEEPTSADAWRARLQHDPGAFSPNVSSRPPLESWLLPVAATVLGPGEIAYWSQLGPLFETLDTPFPALQPRAAWTLIESRIRRLLDRAEVSVDELDDGGDRASEGLTREARPDAVDRALDDLRRVMGKGFDDVGTSIAEQLPGLKAAVGKARKGTFDAVTELSRQIDSETRGRLETRIGQLRRAAANLFPDRKPQERVLSPFHYLARYGPDLIDELAAVTADSVEASLAGVRADG